MIPVSHCHVRDLLRHLSRDRTPRETPLVDLQLVKRRVASAGIRPTRDACTHEIGSLVTTIVESELHTLRSRHTRRKPSGGQAWFQNVVADFRSGHLELESWSAIYHLYLRPDLNLSLGNLQSMLGDRHRRTLQRRLQHGTEALTSRLLTLERQAEAAARRDRLLARLPSSPDKPFVGDGALARSLMRTLAERRRQGVVALAGPPGIGKTSLALRIVHGATVTAPAFEPIWVDARTEQIPVGPGGELLHLVARHSGLEGLEPDAERAVLASAPRLLVIDGLDEPRTAAEVARAAGALPAGVAVLLSGRVGWAAVPDVTTVAVPPLPEPDAIQLLRYEATARGLQRVAESTDESLAELVAAAEGNPLVLRDMVAALRSSAVATVAMAFASGRNIAAGTYDLLWAAQWRAAPTAARRAARLVVQAERKGARPHLAHLAAAWESAETDLETALGLAVDAGLLLPTGDARQPTYASAQHLGRFLSDQRRPAPVGP